MRVEIYGPGCPRCQNTAAMVEKVAQSLGRTVEIVKVTEVEAMLDKGILRTPAVFVDGKKVVEGKVPTEVEVRQWLAGC